MQPKTLSASSLRNWEDCQAKFHAVNIEYIPETGEKNAAKVGTSFHYAAEHFVRKVYIDKTHTWGDEPEEGKEVGGLKLLIALYFEGYKDTFGSANKATEMYKDGLKLLKDWYARTDLSGWIIDNVEEKKRIPIGSTGIKLTYIFDRVQRRVTAEGRRILKVVDYKSIREAKSYDDMEEDVQVRIYGLAAAIEYNEWKPDEIWVELDLLRHRPVGIEVTRAMNEETRDYLVETAWLIQATDEDDLIRTLGPGCQYCPVKATCEPVLKNIANGGILSIQKIEDVLDMRTKLKAQAGAQKLLLEELDETILKHAKATGEFKFSAGENGASLRQNTRRELIDEAKAAEIIGPELMKMFAKFNIGDVDKIIDSGQLGDAKNAQLSALIYKKPTSISVTVKPVSPLAAK